MWRDADLLCMKLRRHSVWNEQCTACTSICIFSRGLCQENFLCVIDIRSEEVKKFSIMVQLSIAPTNSKDQPDFVTGGTCPSDYTTVLH